jgi:serine/threonine protein kinase
VYLTMQLVDGHDLRALLKRVGPVSPQVALGILAPVASALDAAHAHGLVHRDIKPGNILIDEHHGQRQVYLGDFGLAPGKTSATSLTSTGHLIGTADYVSPEQVMGEPVDGPADVSSFGCVLFEMLTGRVPYPGRSETAKLVAHATKEPPLTSRRVSRRAARVRGRRPNGHGT